MMDDDWELTCFVDTGEFPLRVETYVPDGIEDQLEDLPFEVTGTVHHTGKEEMMAKKVARKKAAKKYAAGKAARTKKKEGKKRKKTGDVYDRIRKQREDRERGGGGGFWKPPKGTSIVRCLPFEHDGEPEIAILNARHWGIEDGQRGQVQCSGRDNCPVCEYLESDEPTDRIKQRLRRVRRYLVNVVVRSSPLHDNEDAQAIADLPVTVWEGREDDPGLEDLIIGPDAASNVLDPKKGRDFKIIRKGDGLRTRYEVSPMPKGRPIGMDVNPRDLIDMIAKMEKGEEELAEILEHIKEL